jgi:hypothetical protein
MNGGIERRYQGTIRAPARYPRELHKCAGENAMNKFVAAALICTGIVVAPSIASAGERMGDAAGGAVAGAVVGGPIGAVAGGVIGYTAGPNIAHSMGIRHHYRHRHYTYRDGHRVIVR